MAQRTREPERRERVERRADRRCEYCRAPQPVTGVRYHLDHILPESLGGTDDMHNLAWPALCAITTSPLMFSGLMTEDWMMAGCLIRGKINGTIILCLI